MADRNDRSNIVPVGAGTPAWLQDYSNDKSLDAMKQHLVLSRIGIVQALSDPALKEACGEGAAVLYPSKMKLAGKSESFKFVAVMFFAEYIAWNDRDDSSSPAVHEQSMEKTSPVARKSQDPEKREERYGPDNKFVRRYCEHLNFAGFFTEASGERIPCVLGFVRGEHSTGSRMISSAFIRKVPLWAQVWNLRTGFRDKGPKKKWWGFDVDPSGFIEQEDALFFRTQHEELTKLFEERRLSVDHSDLDPTTTEAPTTSEM